MDVLSDTLHVVRLSGAIFLNATLAKPFAIESPPQRDLAQYLGLSSDCVALFHVLVRGQGWFMARDQEPVLLQSGDAIVFPQSVQHVLSSGDHRPPTPIGALITKSDSERFAAIRAGGLGEITNFICGYLHCDQRFNPLIGALPPLIVIRASQHQYGDDVLARAQTPSPAVLPMHEGDWLKGILEHLVEEALDEQPGNAEMLARLSEILFVEVVRRYMRQLPVAQQGWLAGVRDPVIGQVLRRLHAHPEHAWTVEGLADEVGIARSTLAKRFHTLIGESPMRYLARWRVQLAKSLLTQPHARVAEVAMRVGYDSEAAFSRAFRRHVGCPPASWRTANDAT
jgi:AraC-like DNA-binding protein